MYFKKFLFSTLLGLMLLGSGGCKSQKDYLYLADMTDGQGYAITQRYQPVIQRDGKPAWMQIPIPIISSTPATSTT